LEHRRLRLCVREMAGDFGLNASGIRFSLSSRWRWVAVLFVVVVVVVGEGGTCPRSSANRVPVESSPN